MSIDLVTFIASIASALGIVLGFGQWLLSYRLEKYKAEFEATRQSEIQKEVALYLGEKAAEREYLLEARKRLYRAIGPLKFQLLLACRDAASRIKNYVESPYPMDTKSYYGKTTLYRLLKPITLAELIEDQMAFADFAVDPTAITLLSFKKAVYTAFSDGSILDDYPNPNWRKQEEHLFSNSLAAAARSLIIQDDANGTRCMHFHEFEAFIAGRDARQLTPLRNILNDFTIAKKPIFWLRLVYFGYACHEFVGEAGREVGFERQEYDLAEMLGASESDYVLTNLGRYVELYKDTLKSGL